MGESVDWIVARRDKAGLIRASHGAQVLFGRTSARKLAHELGAPWQVLHASTLEPPPKDDPAEQAA